MTETPRPRTGDQPGPVPEIDVDELAAAVERGELVLDVREPAEFAQAHVPGARLVPLGQLAGVVDQVPRDQRVNVICAVGSRSLVAAEMLRSAGVDAVNVAGGTRAWVFGGRAYDQGLD